MEKRGEKRGIYMIVFSILIMILIISIVSADFSDFLEKVRKTITGKPVGPQEQTIKISVKGANPAQIVYVSQIPNTDPSEFSSTTVIFEVHMYDKNGVNDLDHTSVSANFSLYGVTRFSDVCVRQLPDIDKRTAKYFCTIDMWYWNEAGDWNINVRGRDTGNGSWVYNTTTTFHYNQLPALTISPTELTWPPIISGGLNQTPGEGNFTIINNTGNYNDVVTVNAINLLGETDPSEAIYAENFTVGISTGPSLPECDTNPLINTQLQNATGKDIVNSNSNPGDLSLGGEVGQSFLYYCIPETPLISSQTYSTLTGGSWKISFET